MLSIICVRYRMDVCENVSTSFYTLLLRVLRSDRFLVVLVRRDPRMHVVMIFGGRTDHPCLVRSGYEGVVIFYVSCSLFEGTVIVIHEFKDLDL